MEIYYGNLLMCLQRLRKANSIPATKRYCENSRQNSVGEWLPENLVEEDTGVNTEDLRTWQEEVLVWTQKTWEPREGSPGENTETSCLVRMGHCCEHRSIHEMTSQKKEFSLCIFVLLRWVFLGQSSRHTLTATPTKWIQHSLVKFEYEINLLNPPHAPGGYFVSIQGRPGKAEVNNYY